MCKEKQSKVIRKVNDEHESLYKETERKTFTMMTKTTTTMRQKKRRATLLD